MNNRNFKPYILQLLAALLGVGTSLYLLVQHTRLKSGIQGGSSFCELGKYANCNVVQSSTYSEIAGIPLALLGFLYFLTLLILGTLQGPGSPTFGRAQLWMARLSALALAIDAYLFGVQAFALKSFCLFCLFTYLCSFAHIAFNYWMAPVGRRNWRGFLRDQERAKIPSAVWATVIVCVGLFGFSLKSYIDGEISSEQSANLEQSKKGFIETWSLMPRKEIPLNSTDASWGNPQAKVRVVVFSDFECPHCQRGAFALQTALAPEQDRVQLVFKNFPLDMSCNSLLQAPIHANACALAYLGFCANRKGKFWDFHDRVFFKLSARELSSSQEKIYDGVKSIFTKQEFDDCLKDPVAQSNARSDIALGAQLGINSTPSVFINGRQVLFAPTVDLIRTLVQKEQ
ncbi:thioredoxin domain-containing protein [bacterium]|nr:thioredoxin domain-containing protein [bacterium]